MVMLVQCGGERGVGCVRAMVVVVAEKVWRGCDGEGGTGRWEEGAVRVDGSVRVQRSGSTLGTPRRNTTSASSSSS